MKRMQLDNLAHGGSMRHFIKHIYRVGIVRESSI